MESKKRNFNYNKQKTRSSTLAERNKGKNVAQTQTKDSEQSLL